MSVSVSVSKRLFFFPFVQISFPPLDHAWHRLLTNTHPSLQDYQSTLSLYPRPVESRRLEKPAAYEASKDGNPPPIFKYGKPHPSPPPPLSFSSTCAGRKMKEMPLKRGAKIGCSFPEWGEQGSVHYLVGLFHPSIMHACMRRVTETLKVTCYYTRALEDFQSAENKQA